MRRDEGPVAAPSSRGPLRLVVQLVAVAVASLLLGALTSFGQTVLPDALRSIANSASIWTLLTAALVASCRARTLPSALLGIVGFVALVGGYQITSGLRGYGTSETFFLIAGVVVGPFVGIATSWLRRGGWRTVLGCGVLCGITIGESAYGLLVVAATTGVTSWIVIGVVGVALLVLVLIRALHGVRDRLLAIGLTAVVAIAFLLAYQVAGGV